MTTDERKKVNRPQHPSKSQLTVYSLGNGTESFRAAVAKHLQSCSICAEVLESVQEASRPNLAESDTVSSDHEGQPDLRDRPPELIDHPQYAVERELGRGGMGIVYLVKHKLTGRHEALKVLMPSLVARHDVRIRFMREIQSAASLDHPNICRTFNALNDGEVLGLVMEYLPGSDLAQIVKKHGPIPVRSACSLAIQLCAGLQHAHEKGMIHRDIKPGNLMVDKTPKGLRLKILDFGLARGIMDESPDQKDLTVAGRVLGTPEYMSPEQALTPSNVDIRSDLYSVGCVLYFMLSGSAPFQGETMFSILQAHISKPATPLSAINPEIPESLETIVAQLLEKDRSLRPNCPADVARLLTPFVTSTAAMPNGMSPIPKNPTHDKPTGATTEQIPFTARIPVRKRKPKSSWLSWLPIFLPTVLLFVGAFFFQAQIRTEWKRLTGPSTSQIIIEKMPSDYEIWVDDQKTSFTRPNANSPAQVTALPGSYKLTLKRQGETMREETVTVIAGRDVRITVNPIAPSSTAKTPVTPDRSLQREQNSPTPEKPREPVRESFPSPEEVRMAIDDAKIAFRNRDGSAATAALAPMFNERGELRLRDFQPESAPVRQLQKFASALLDFNQRLSSSIAKRQPNESVYVGLVRYTLLDQLKRKLAYDGTTKRYNSKPLSCLLRLSNASLIWNLIMKRNTAVSSKRSVYSIIRKKRRVI